MENNMHYIYTYLDYVDERTELLTEIYEIEFLRAKDIK